MPVTAASSPAGFNVPARTGPVASRRNRPNNVRVAASKVALAPPRRLRGPPRAARTAATARSDAARTAASAPVEAPGAVTTAWAMAAASGTLGAGANVRTRPWITTWVPIPNGAATGISPTRGSAAAKAAPASAHRARLSRPARETAAKGAVRAPRAQGVAALRHAVSGKRTGVPVHDVHGRTDFPAKARRRQAARRAPRAKRRRRGARPRARGHGPTGWVARGGKDPLPPGPWAARRAPTTASVPWALAAAAVIQAVKARVNAAHAATAASTDPWGRTPAGSLEPQGPEGPRSPRVHPKANAVTSPRATAWA